MGKSTMSMAIFNSKLLVITRGYLQYWVDEPPKRVIQFLFWGCGVHQGTKRMSLAHLIAPREIVTHHGI